MQTHKGGRLYLKFSSLLRNSLFCYIIPRSIKTINPLAAAGLQEFVKSPEIRSRGASVLSGIISFLRIIPWIIYIAASIFFHIIQKVAFANMDGNLWLYAKDNVERKYQTLKQEMLSHQDKSPKERLEALTKFLQSFLLFSFHSLMFYPVAGMVSMDILSILAKNKKIDQNLLDTCLKGFEGSLTTEMDLQVVDLADSAMKNPHIIDLIKSDKLLHHITLEQFYQQVSSFPGETQEFISRFKKFIQEFGMRGLLTFFFLFLPFS